MAKAQLLKFGRTSLLNGSICEQEILLPTDVVFRSVDVVRFCGAATGIINEKVSGEKYAKVKRDKKVIANILQFSEKVQRRADLCRMLLCDCKL